MEKKQQALLFLDRNGFYFYTAGMDNVATCVFPETILKDLEVVDPLGMENQIKVFVTQWGIPSVDIVIILSSNVIFEKQITSGSGELEEINKFLDSIPFERFEKLVTVEGGNKKIFAVNKNLTFSIEASFIKLKSSVSIILPYYPLANLLQTIPIDVTTAVSILKKANDLKSYNMKHIEEVKIQKAAPDNSTGRPQATPSKPNRTRVYILGGVFAVLIIVLVFMFVNMK